VNSGIRIAPTPEDAALEQEPWRRVEELFHAALELSPEARAAMLEAWNGDGWRSTA
jgi:hypothetical protein